MRDPLSGNKISRLYLLAAATAVVLAVMVAVQPRLPEGLLRKGVADLFVWIVLAAAAAAMLARANDWLGELGFGKREKLAAGLFVLVMYAAGFLFVKNFFNAEDDIKVYDSTVYWINVIADRDIISGSIPQYLVHLRSTFAREYNHLAVLPLLPASRVFGVDFAGYCLSVLFVYYLPACLFLAIFIMRLTAAARPVRPGVFAFVACFCLCALCVCFLWPVMNGYLDVAGALLFALLLNVSLRWDCTEFSVKKNLVLAALSLLMVLARRWYAFNIVGFYAAFGITAFIAMAAEGRLALKRLGALIGNMFMIAAVCAVCFLIINPALFGLFLGGDYATAYSAMKTMGMLRNMWEITENMGVLWIAAAYLGMYLLLGGDASRLACLRLLITAGLSFYLFCRIQYMGYHQDYLVIPTLLALAGVAYARIAEFASGNGKRLVPIAVLLLGATAVNFLYGYEPRLRAAAAATEPLTTVMRRYPRRNGDNAAIRKIVDDLAEKIGGGSRYVYVVGDSIALSPELLKRSQLPEKTDAAPFVLVGNIMDLRDGFPSQFFLAEYAVIHDPYVTEFTSPQQTTFQLNDMLLHDAEMEQFYRKDASYAVSTGNIVVFRKIEAPDRRCVDNLRDRLRRFYPDAPFVYEPNYFIALCRVDEDTGYSFDFWDDRSFTFRKAAGVPARVRLEGTQGLSTLSFAASCREAGLELRVLNQRGEIARQPLAQGEKVPYRLDVSGSESLIIAIAEANADALISGDVVVHHPDLR